MIPAVIPDSSPAVVPSVLPADGTVAASGFAITCSWPGVGDETLTINGTDQWRFDNYAPPAVTDDVGWQEVTPASAAGLAAALNAGFLEVGLTSSVDGVVVTLTGVSSVVAGGTAGLWSVEEV